MIKSLSHYFTQELYSTSLNNLYYRSSQKILHTNEWCYQVHTAVWGNHTFEFLWNRSCLFTKYKLDGYPDSSTARFVVSVWIQLDQIKMWSAVKSATLGSITKLIHFDCVSEGAFGQRADFVISNNTQYELALDMNELCERECNHKGEFYHRICLNSTMGF